MLESGSEGILQRVRVMKFVDFWRQNLTNFQKIRCLKKDSTGHYYFSRIRL